MTLSPSRIYGSLGQLGAASKVAVIPWWLSGGIAAANCIAAYQPKGAASLAASYDNLTGNATYDAALGVAPTWDVVSGWKFDGATQYLRTGVVPENDQTWSAVGSVSELSTWYILGAYNSGTAAEISLFRSGTYLWACNGGALRSATISGTGVYAFVGNKVFINGLAQVGVIPASGGALALQFYIGVGNWDGVAMYFSHVHIKALAIFDCVLTPAQVLAISTAMAAL
jgi:hypothetical protein